MLRECDNCRFHVQAGTQLPQICTTCEGLAYSGDLVPMWAEKVIHEIDVPESFQKETSDGSSANYYKLPAGSSELQDLISHRNMNAQIGEIFRACFRYGLVSHSPEIRDIKKILFYANAELKRLEKLK